MFRDLVGSTALSARVDPEDLRSAIGAYHKCVAETVGRFNESTASFLVSSSKNFYLRATARNVSMWQLDRLRDFNCTDDCKFGHAHLAGSTRWRALSRVGVTALLEVFQKWQRAMPSAPKSSD
jgi:class 3 adenylate cyclase